MTRFSRRELLRLGVLASAGVLAACAPKVVKETVLVEKPVEKVVEKIVKETVIIAGTPKVVEKVVKETVVVKEEVEKLVKQTVIVEKVRDTILIRWHHRLGGWKVYTDRIAAFEEANPGVKINEEEFPAGSAEYGPKIASLVAAGMVGDCTWVAFGSGSFQFLGGNKALAALDEFIAADDSGFTLDEFFPHTVTGMRLGPGGQGTGELFSLPELTHGVNDLLWLNKSLIEKKGFEPPNNDWTRQQLIELAVKMREGNVYGFLPATGDYSNTRNNTLPWGGELISPDGKESLFETDEVKAGMRWVYDCFYTDECAPTAAEQTGGLNQMFLAERIAMYQSGGWQLSQREVIKDKFEWDMCLMPKGPAGHRGGHLHCDGESVTAQSKNKKLAYEFCKYLTDHEGQVGIALEIGLVARPAVYKDPRITKDPYVVTMGVGIGEAAPHHGSFNLRKQELQTTVKALADPLWVGDREPDDAYFAEISAEFQDFLDKSAEG